MPLPPKGDLRRPLHFAVRSMWVLGILFLLFGTCGLSSFLTFTTAPPAGGRAVSFDWVRVLIAVSVLLFYLIPGALYIFFAVYLRRHRMWAVVAALVLASIHTLFIVIGVIGMVVQILLGKAQDMPALARAIMGAVALLVLAAFAQLLYHLSRSFRALPMPPFGTESRGFEPLPLTPGEGRPTPWT